MSARQGKPESAAHGRPTQFGNVAQHLREQDILPAEDVALADLPLMQRREVAAGHIVHMHKVEPGIDESGNAAPGGFDDDPAGGRSAARHKGRSASTD